MRHLRLPKQSLINMRSFKPPVTNLNDFGRNKSDSTFVYLQEVSKPSCSSESTKPLKKRKNAYIKVKTLPSTPLVKKILFKCRVCEFTGRTKRTMFKHLESHVGSPISCRKCKKTFNGKPSFDWHLDYYCKSLATEKPFICGQCNKAFKYKRNLRSHLQGHKRNNCFSCDKVLTKRIHLIKHLLEDHSIKLDRKTYKCDYCEKKYIKKCSLFYHIRQHFPEKKVCLECGHFSNNVEEDAEHKKQHDLKKMFKCQKCDDRFCRRQTYLLHLKRHNQYKCVTCNESYASREKVMKHKQEGHKIEGIFPKFTCPHCPLSFYRKAKLVVHIGKHNKENKTVDCKYCNKTLKSPYAYYKHCLTMNHERVGCENNNNNNLICKICGKNFRNRYLLRHHILRIHSFKVFSCPHCGYKNNSKYNMERHVALHFRCREFTCEHCGKIFDSMAILKDHISYNHVQEKQLKCDECDKSFKRNSELVRHKSTHSNERAFCCDICDKSYKRSTHLKRHKETAHNVTFSNNRKIRKISDENKKATKKKIIVHQDIFLNIDGADSNSLNIDQLELVESLFPEGNEALYDVYYKDLVDGNILG